MNTRLSATLIAVVIAILLLVGTFWIGYSTGTKDARSERGRTDTTVSYILVPPPPPDTVELAGKVRLVERTLVRDSIVYVPTETAINFDTLTRLPDGRLVVAPFIAEGMTVNKKGDTTTGTYTFPANKFHFMSSYAPDSMKVQTVTVTITERPPWWETALTHLGTLAVGYGMGRIR
ncbi:MAG: hypothetical protein IPF79_04630 [Ignavibacteria bacterium]|nr:hypothetical protein [Ignavibacteria bacterium]